MAPAEDERPVIVTLALDDASQQHFDELRTAWFPSERNHLRAHVTLFHALPGAALPALLEDAAAVSPARRFPVAVTGLRFLGRGVAYALASPGLSGVRAELARTWASWLGPQDRQPFRPHVTVQNKVGGGQARALLAELEAEFVPFAVRAEALLLWRYLGGPWAPAGRVPFGGAAAFAERAGGAGNR